jgi:hypothetical protein
MPKNPTESVSGPDGLDVVSYPQNYGEPPHLHPADPPEPEYLPEPESIEF